MVAKPECRHLNTHAHAAPLTPSPPTSDTAALTPETAASAAEAVAQVQGPVGPLDQLANNTPTHPDWRETPSLANLAVAQAVFDANLFGAWRVTQAFLPLLQSHAAADHPTHVVIVSVLHDSSLPPGGFYRDGRALPW